MCDSSASIRRAFLSLSNSPSVSTSRTTIWYQNSTTSSPKSNQTS
jgi:hypothetical protein